MRRRVGRPKAKASEKRGEIIRFVVTREEDAKIRARAKADGLSLSDYIRKSTLGGR